MSSTTVAEFANELKKSTETLLDQLKSAGVAKSAAADVVTDADKHRLLSFLQSSHGTASADRKKITLVKKQTTEIKQADATGKARTIQVEVRKKRTFVRRDDGSDQPGEAQEVEAAASAPVAHVIDQAELARREEEARRQAELIRRQEEELSQRRGEREEQEARAREAAERASAEASAQQASAPASPAPDNNTSSVVAPAKPDAAETAKAADDAKAAEAGRAQAAAAASKALADEEVARAADLGARRRMAEA
ncbi:MAG: translation initiation factor IF-2 associated domain-containing protein, partial [Rhodoferax sp.]